MSSSWRSNSARGTGGDPQWLLRGPQGGPGTPTWPWDPRVAQGAPHGTGTPTWHRDPCIAQGPPRGSRNPHMAQGPPPQVAQGPPHSPRTPTWHRDPHVAQGPPQGTGTPAWPRDPCMAPGPPCGSGTPPLHWLHCSPAFLVVRYIILFFLLPLRLPHKAPAEGTGMLEPGLGTAPQHGDIAGGVGEGGLAPYRTRGAPPGPASRRLCASPPAAGWG